MSMMRKWKRQMLAVATASTLIIGALPGLSHAATSSDKISIPQGVGQKVLDQANYFGDMDPNALVTVDIVLKVQNKNALTKYINDTVTPGNKHYHNYLSVDQFANNYAPSSTETNTIVNYLQSFGLKTSVEPNNLVITVTGQVKHINDAFNVDLQKASYKGKAFHATKKAPQAPKNIADNILCILGLSDYSSLVSNSIKQLDNIEPKDENAKQGPLSLAPQDLIKQYNVGPLYDKGATGSGQTIGIVSLADFNLQDPYTFWDQMGIKVNPNRLTKIKVDGGSGWDGYDETTLDIEQSGALAPQANIRAYIAPNSDTGFVDGLAQAITNNKIQSLSVSWGQSEAVIDYATKTQQETPEYAETFNQLFMEAAAQGISTFASAGDEGAYDNAKQAGQNGIPNIYQLTVDNPADSPYITAAGGTTLPWQITTSLGNIEVDKERAWGWDYLGPYFMAKHIDPSQLVEGGGGGFSSVFNTPDYQDGVSGVNTYTDVQNFNFSDDLLNVDFNSNPSVTQGSGTGRNLPDLSMDADPYTGYLVYLSDPGTPGQNSAFKVYGGTSLVAPQLNGLTALINSAGHTKVGFWNPQIYRFAQQSNSPFTPLTDSGKTNDNLYYSGTPGTIYNQATGLGTPDVAALANDFLGK
jgi:kumamolisin